MPLQTCSKKKVLLKFIKKKSKIDMLKKYHIALLIAPVLLISCIRSSKKPGRAYMPDMTYSTAYDAGSPNPIFKDGKTNQFAPKGSVAIGKYIYHLPNTPETLVLFFTHANSWKARTSR